MNIENLINPLLRLSVESNRVILRETENENREQTLQEVIITALPDNTIAYSADIQWRDNTPKDRKLYNEYLHIPSPSLIRREGANSFWLNNTNFNSVEPIDKRSDGIVICRNENEISVIICDLKSTKYGLKECSDKFMNDKLFLDYMLSILRIIFKENITTVTIKYAIFYLKTGLDDKSSPRTPREDLLKIEEDNMIGYNERLLKIPFDKTQHNYIEWDKIINH
jgi:hypothetical protein